MAAIVGTAAMAGIVAMDTAATVATVAVIMVVGIMVGTTEAIAQQGTQWLESLQEQQWVTTWVLTTTILATLHARTSQCALAVREESASTTQLNATVFTRPVAQELQQLSCFS